MSLIHKYLVIQVMNHFLRKLQVCSGDQIWCIMLNKSAMIVSICNLTCRIFESTWYIDIGNRFSLFEMSKTLLMMSSSKWATQCTKNKLSPLWSVQIRVNSKLHCVDDSIHGCPMRHWTQNVKMRGKKNVTWFHATLSDLLAQPTPSQRCFPDSHTNSMPFNWSVFSNIPSLYRTSTLMKPENSLHLRDTWSSPCTDFECDFLEFLGKDCWLSYHAVKSIN